MVLVVIVVSDNGAWWSCCKVEDVIDMPRYANKMCISFTEIRETLDWITQLNIVWLELQQSPVKSAIYWNGRHGPFSFAFWTPVNRGSYKTTIVFLSFTSMVGQFNIFLGNGLLVFPWLFIGILFQVVSEAKTNN